MLRNPRAQKATSLALSVCLLWSLLMSVGFLTEQLGTNALLRVRIAWGANLNANSSTWTWVDVTSDVQQENGKYINISPMGRPPEATQTPPAMVVFTLDNRANLYSKNNPLCSNWPNVRQYTPVQVQITLNNGTNWWTVFQGEASEWKAAWDTTGNYAVTVVTAKGRIQRQNQHNQPLRSAMERFISTMSPVPVGYWPLEDGPNTLQAQSPITGVGSAVRQYDDGFALPLPAWGLFTNTAPGSDAGADFKNGGTVTAPIVGGTAGTTGWTVAFAFNVGASFQSTDFIVPVTFITGADYWYFTMNLGGPTDFEWRLHHTTATGSTDTAVTNPTWASTFYPFDDAEHLVVATAVQSGGNINWTFKIYKDDSVVWTFSGSTAGTLLPVTNVSIGNDDSTTSFSWTVQHVSVWNGYNTVSADTLIFKLYGDRLINETPKDRASRLCGEEGVEFTTDGFYDSTVAMGPQPSKPFMDNLRLCERSGDDFMYDGLNAGLSWQGISQRNDQNTAITIAITDLAKTFDPLDNDLNSINQVRVDRDGGSFYIGERTTGILGTGADGIGVVQGQVTVSNNSDDLLPHRANWETWKGTVAGYRYPLLYLDVAARPSLAAKWINRSDGGTGPITPGSKMVVTSPASYATQHPVENLELCITGWAMRLSRFLWQIDVMCENNHIYDVNKIGDSGLGNLETAGSSTATSASNGATTIYVKSKNENTWSKAGGDYSKLIYVDGIKCTVSAVADSASDTFTRTVSNSWGTPDVSPAGAAYAQNGGAAGDRSATGTRARHSSGSVGVTRYDTFDLMSTDFDYTVQCIIPVAVNASGAPITQRCVGRFTDTSNFYTAQLQLDTSGGISLILAKNVASTFTTLSTVVEAASGHAAGDTWTVRFQCIDNALKAKAWFLTEPDWQIQLTDTSLTTGTQIGMATRLETGNTNTSPVLTEFDNLTVTNPQKFTISGLTKALVADRDVHLWTPGVLRY